MWLILNYHLLVQELSRETHEHPVIYSLTASLYGLKCISAITKWLILEFFNQLKTDRIFRFVIDFSTSLKIFCAGYLGIYCWKCGYVFVNIKRIWSSKSWQILAKTWLISNTHQILGDCEQLLFLIWTHIISESCKMKLVIGITACQYA